MRKELMFRVVAVSDRLEIVWIQKTMSFRTFMFFAYKYLRKYITNFEYSNYTSIVDYFYSYSTNEETYIFKII